MRREILSGGRRFVLDVLSFMIFTGYGDENKGGGGCICLEFRVRREG